MKAELTNKCQIKALVWDNESVLTNPDWNACYDRAYSQLRVTPPQAGHPSRGKQYKKMLSVPIVPEISQHLNTFISGNEENNYLQSYTSSHISTEEFWRIACQYGFGLQPTEENVEAIRTAQIYLLRNPEDRIHSIPSVIDILAAAKQVLPQFMLSNTNPEIYESIQDADFLKLIPEQNRLFSIFTKCRKPCAASYQTLIERAGCAPQEIVFIDDKDINIEAAQKHGIQGILFNGQKESENVLIEKLRTFDIIISN